MRACNEELSDISGPLQHFSHLGNFQGLPSELRYDQEVSWAVGCLRFGSGQEEINFAAETTYQSIDQLWELGSTFRMWAQAMDK